MKILTVAIVFAVANLAGHWLGGRLAGKLPSFQPFVLRSGCYALLSMAFVAACFHVLDGFTGPMPEDLTVRAGLVIRIGLGLTVALGLAYLPVEFLRPYLKPLLYQYQDLIPALRGRGAEAAQAMADRLYLFLLGFAFVLLLIAGSAVFGPDRADERYEDPARIPPEQLEQWSR